MRADHNPRVIPLRDMWGALAVALGMRLLCIALFAYSESGGDMDYYDAVARNILEHKTASVSAVAPFIPTTYRPPLFPAFVALVRFGFGDHHFALQIVQSLLGTAAVAFVAQGAATINRRLGRGTLWALALSPYEAVYAGALLSEALTGFFLAAALACPLVLRTPRRWLLCGAFFGLAALTRDIYMLLIPGYAVYAAVWLLRGNRRATRGRAAVAILVAGIAVIAPWTTRNYVHTHAFVPIARSVLARSLWQGTWVVDRAHVQLDEQHHQVQYPPWAFALPGEREAYEHAVTLEEGPRDREYIAMFKRRWREMPGHSALAYIEHAPYIWVGTSRFEIFTFRSSMLQRGRPLNTAVKAVLYGANYAIVLVGFGGMVLALRRWNRRMLWFTLPALYLVAVFLPLDVLEPRYTEPIFSTVVVMALYALRAFRIFVRRRRGRPRAKPQTVPASA